MAARICCFCLAKHLSEKKTFSMKKSLLLKPDIFLRTYASLDICVDKYRFRSYLCKSSSVGAKGCRTAFLRWNLAVSRFGIISVTYSRKLKTTSLWRAAEETDTGKTTKRLHALKSKLEKVKEIKEDILTIPNLLSTLRIVAAPVLAYLIMSEDYITATVLFGVAGITDMLDGYIARNFKNQKSVFGTALDPLSDKIFISTLILSLTAVSLLPVPLTVLILSRDVVLVMSAFYLRYKSLPSPKTISRYFDFNLPTVELRPTFISKVNTVLQLGLVGCTLLAPIFHYVDHPYLQGCWYVVAGSTILSGASYVLSKSTVRYLK